jgi:hypothetical protein
MGVRAQTGPDAPRSWWPFVPHVISWDFVIILEHINQHRNSKYILTFPIILVSIIAPESHNRCPVTWRKDRGSTTDPVSGSTSHHENIYANTTTVSPAYHCNDEDSIPGTIHSVSTANKVGLDRSLSEILGVFSPILIPYSFKFIWSFGACARTLY